MLTSTALSVLVQNERRKLASISRADSQRNRKHTVSACEAWRDLGHFVSASSTKYPLRLNQLKWQLFRFLMDKMGDSQKARERQTSTIVSCPATPLVVESTHMCMGVVGNVMSPCAADAVFDRRQRISLLHGSHGSFHTATSSDVDRRGRLLLTFPCACDKGQPAALFGFRLPVCMWLRPCMPTIAELLCVPCLGGRAPSWTPAWPWPNGTHAVLLTACTHLLPRSAAGWAPHLRTYTA